MQHRHQVDLQIGRDGGRLTEIAQMALPPALPPLLQMRSFGTQGGVIPVTWVHHGVIVETSEDLLFEIIH